MSKETSSDENQGQEPNRRPPLNPPKPLPPRKAPVPQPETAFPFQVPSQRPETNDQNGRSFNPVYQQPPETQQREQYQGPYNPSPQDYYGQQNQQVPFNQIPQYNQQPQQQGYNPQQQQYGHAQGYNGQPPQYGNQAWNNNQQPPQKPSKNLIIIISSIIGFMLFIAVVLGIVISISNNAGSTEAKNLTPTEDVNGEVFDQTTFVYTQDTRIMISMNPSAWTETSSGQWKESSGQCAVGFYPMKDGNWGDTFVKMDGSQARQLFYEDAGKVSYSMTPAEMQKNQAASDMSIDDQNITLYSTPIANSDGTNSWIGTTAWVEEGTYFDVVMNCKDGVSATATRSMWLEVLDNTDMMSYSS